MTPTVRAIGPEAADVPDARDAPALRWGVLGTGWIADRFVASIRRYTTQSTVAVGSRSLESGRRFAAAHGVERAYGSYEQLVADPGVDVVYVATPHTEHLAHALLSIAAGKHVLVEKPLALNADEARSIAGAAAVAGVFCAEALWTFFLPKFVLIRRMLQDGALGEIHAVAADMCEYFPPGHRILDPALAGGTMLDLGTYPVSLATAVLGELDIVDASVQRHPSGVDGQVAAILAGGAGGAQAVIRTSLYATVLRPAVVSGTAGSILIDAPFYQPGAFAVLSAEGEVTARFAEPRIAHLGLHHEAAAVARAIGQGLREAAERPLADSIRTLTVMDGIRRQGRIAYPGEGGARGTPGVSRLTAAAGAPEGGTP